MYLFRNVLYIALYEENNFVTSHVKFEMKYVYLCKVWLMIHRATDTAFAKPTLSLPMSNSV